jgi:copper homeostasis protein
MPHRHLLLEICVCSVEDCQAARLGGADRLELNSALALGGLTPSLGSLIEARTAVPLPIVSMIRPRPGGFCYSSEDFRVMQRDLELALEHGADGFAFGVLLPNGEVDVERCELLMRLAAGKEAVFHRAFDVVPDPARALEQLVDLGLKRVMTSGQEASAYNGAARIAGIIRQAAGRIEILPAGGINRFTLDDVVTRTGCDQVHASLTTSRADLSTAARAQVSFGGTFAPPEDRFKVTDQDAVADIRRRLDETAPIR